ncbi:hypothetical protein Y1Q_0019359 [Alligator mississippiensis]|uniref:Uncharacterized protein n=1 Tax=Alligator mississippiensis TaxID=8496 RepID=A0A151MQY4_ALLMI|nr:hypothetical protein Y1Q_0019359 [Alligator mississippiensis]
MANYSYSSTGDGRACDNRCLLGTDHITCHRSRDPRSPGIPYCTARKNRIITHHNNCSQHPSVLDIF